MKTRQINDDLLDHATGMRIYFETNGIGTKKYVRVHKHTPRNEPMYTQRGRPIMVTVGVIDLLENTFTPSEDAWKRGLSLVYRWLFGR